MHPRVFGRSKGDRSTLRTIVYIVPGLTVGVALVVFAAAWQSWRARTRLLARIRAGWGRPRDRVRDMDAVADLFRARHAAPVSLDDRTWNDLLMDDVFAYLDRTESGVGQQMLYCRLRATQTPSSLHAERIAAAVAVLETLVGGRKPHVVLVATHDGELVELLDNNYAVCHLGDAVGPNGLVFDYCLLPGPATSRSAIALLKLNGAPESVVGRALELAAALDLQRQ